MAPGNTNEVKLQRGDDATELSRLRRELEEVRTRLDEETAYYRAEIEASRQRLERDSTRLQADEVARRRRLEEQLAAAKAELREAQQELAALREREADLSARLVELTADHKAQVRQAVEEAQTAASAAWEEAEQELNRQERELDAMRKLLAGEQQARKTLEQSLARAKEEAARAHQAEQETARLVTSLKKALWATAQARRQAETALDALHANPGQQHVHREAAVATTVAEPEPVRVLSDGVHEVSENALKSIFFGDLSDNLADDFLLTPGDASLDSETLDRLRSLPPVVPEAPVKAASAPAPVRAPTKAAAETAPPQPPRQPRPAEKPVVVPPPDARSEPMLGVQSDGMRRLLRNLILGAAATGGLYWLLTDGNGQRLLATLSELLR